MLVTVFSDFMYGAVTIAGSTTTILAQKIFTLQTVTVDGQSPHPT